jgi:hypothetical protein
MNTEDRKRAATEFLWLAREGNRAAAEKLVAPAQANWICPQCPQRPPWWNVIPQRAFRVSGGA